MPLTLDQLNAAPLPEALQMLDGLYEHSPWIAERALAQRPFASLAQLKLAVKSLEHDHFLREITAWERRFLLPQV